MWIQPHDSCADFSYLNEVLDQARYSSRWRLLAMRVAAMTRMKGAERVGIQVALIPVAMAVRLHPG